MATSRPIFSRTRTDNVRHESVIDLGGSASQVFQFAVPPALTYEYFNNIPAVFRLLPDTLDVSSYAPDHYRLIVGADDGMGHTMAATFDLHAQHAPNQHIRLVPIENGPEITAKGSSFRGELWAESVFKPSSIGTTVEYSIEIKLTIPLPGILGKMPQGFLQNLGERGMIFKLSHMITNFTHAIEHDFARWSRDFQTLAQPHANKPE